MRKFIFALLSCLCLAACSTFTAAAVPLTMHRVSGGACSDDGHTGAPAGAPINFPGFRSTVAFPPACQIPDVDYGVGVNPALLVHDPLTETPAGADAYYGPFNTLGCTTGTDVVFDGYNFGLHGGIGLYVNGCTRVTIKNSKFAKGTTCAQLKTDAGTTDVTLLNVEFDGGGAAAQAACEALGTDNGEMVQLLNNGAHIVHYVRIHDVNQHFITYGGTGTVDELGVSRYNCGYQQGAHCNGWQAPGAVLSSVSLLYGFNYDAQPTVSSGSLSATCTAPNTVAVTVLSNQGSFRPNMHLTGGCFAGTALITAVSDPANGPFPNGPDVVTLTVDVTVTTNGSTTAASPDIFPEGMVIPFRIQNDGGGSSLGAITVKGQVFGGPGPIKGVTYGVNCVGVTSLVMTNNYWDPANAAALMTSGSCPTTGSGNVRMDTGATTSVP